MYKIILTILCTVLFFNISAQNTIPCTPQIERHLVAIQKIPEARQLIEAIQKEGPIRIVVNNTPLAQEFGAYWDPFHRVITVASSPKMTDGTLIGSILFELQNAAVDRKFQELDDLAFTRQINRDRYIESMEYIEYINSHNAARIAEKGIQMGVFPRDARLPTYKTFKEHFRLQKMSGHSNCFGQNFDMITRS